MDLRGIGDGSQYLPLREQARFAKMAVIQSGSSRNLTSPQFSLSEKRPISSRLRSTKADLRKSTPSQRDPASSQTFIDLETEVSRTSKRQRQSVISTNLAGSQSIIDLVNNEPPVRKLQSQPRSSKTRATPRVLVSITSPISTKLGSDEANLQPPSAFDEGPVCCQTFSDLTTDEPSNCEQQRHGVTTTNIKRKRSQERQQSETVHQRPGKVIQCMEEGFQQRDGAVTSTIEPERSQPGQQSDTLYQQSDKAMQCLGKDFKQQNRAITSFAELEQSQPGHESENVRQMTIQCLREEVQQLRRENSDQRARQFASMNSFITSAAVIELVVAVREAELAYGLGSIGGAPEEMLKQAQQMTRYSNATSLHVSRLVNKVLEEQKARLNDDQQKALSLAYMSAQPSQATAAILEEKLLFVLERSRK